MNVVDSSGWLEYFGSAPNADAFAEPILNTEELIVPTVCVVEVFRRVMSQAGEKAAFTAAGIMKNGTYVDLDVTVALVAGKLGKQARLPLADSIILATARLYGALLWTQDEHFFGLPGVRFIPKKRDQ
jgi:predicted nucleic acid-binding protein